MSMTAPSRMLSRVVGRVTGRVTGRVVGRVTGRGDGTERGTTLVEAMVAATLFLTVSFAAFDMLDSFTRTDQKLGQVAQVQRDLHETLEAVARDLRGATSITALSSSVTHAGQIDILTPSIDGLVSLPVRWRQSGGRLLREPLVSVGGVPSSSRTFTSGLTAAPGASFIEYFRSDGTEMVPGVATALDLANCTTRLRVTLAKSPGPGRPATVASIDVALRNRVPGSLGC